MSHELHLYRTVAFEIVFIFYYNNLLDELICRNENFLYLNVCVAIVGSSKIIEV